MNNSYFITGTGTNVGKTVVSAIAAEALEADYWKPVQAGFANGTDSEWVAGMLSNKRSVIYPEVYKLRLAASPHIAAREENININLQEIVDRRPLINNLIIEGAGGLMVPLNEDEFVLDLVKSMRIRVILVSRNESFFTDCFRLQTTGNRCCGMDIQRQLYELRKRDCPMERYSQTRVHSLYG
jgi:dethiobiotin synthetase